MEIDSSRPAVQSPDLATQHQYSPLTCHHLPTYVCALWLQGSVQDSQACVACRRQEHNSDLLLLYRANAASINLLPLMLSSTLLPLGPKEFAYDSISIGEILLSIYSNRLDEELVATLGIRCRFGLHGLKENYKAFSNSFHTASYLAYRTPQPLSQLQSFHYWAAHNIYTQHQSLLEKPVIVGVSLLWRRCFHLFK